MLKAIRWGDHDRYFGPFTWSWSKDYPHWAVVLKSRGDDDVESGICSLRVSLRRATLIIALPGIVRPWREKVYPQWDAETIKRLGRDYYWNVDPRQYGFSLIDGFLQVYYGRTGGSSADSSIQQQWSHFLPWTQWRHIRWSLYDLKGEHFWTQWDWVDALYRNRPDLRDERWELRRKWEAMCPVVKFAFKDFDEQELVATTRIEEREWRFGTGWFKWLSWFRRPKISRSLNIEFSGETGPEKGSWKGGTVGTSIEMSAGEDHETAFRRYCNEQHRSKYRKYSVTFLSRLPAE